MTSKDAGRRLRDKYAADSIARNTITGPIVAFALVCANSTSVSLGLAKRTSRRAKQNNEVDVPPACVELNSGL